MFKKIFKNMSQGNTESIEKEIIQEEIIQDNNVPEENVSETQELKELELTTEEQLTLDLAAEKDKHLRLFAEFENYKKRTSKERMELFKTANQDVVQSILPILDDFDRAMVQLATSEDEGLVKGVQLIHEKLKSTLISKGLEEVSVRAGDIFNADFAEAITQIPAANAKMKGKIVDVLEKGYKLGDKIIRFPKVVIGQ
jgi:molecular chaperone GrpE